jgi:hypothetical protein
MVTPGVQFLKGLPVLSMAKIRSWVLGCTIKAQNAWRSKVIK